MSENLATDAEIAFILPLYNKFAYGRRAALSFLKYTERPGMIITVDDASPYYPKQNWDAWKEGIPPERLVFKHFGKNAGLTRSWNWGLQKARDMGIKYCICGNSDVIFTKHWEHGLIYQATEGGYSLVGPLSNAPGPTNGGKQRIENFFPSYKLGVDDPDYLNGVADYLHSKIPVTQITEININGFFMLAQTERWWEGRFNDQFVFDPSKVMTGNEDELQRRWHKKGFRTGFVPSSFIFHYRAVSRGDRYKHKGWMRIDDINKPV